jgi:hypothetical protein
VDENRAFLSELVALAVATGSTPGDKLEFLTALKEYDPITSADGCAVGAGRGKMALCRVSVQGRSQLTCKPNRPQSLVSFNWLAFERRSTDAYAATTRRSARSQNTWALNPNEPSSLF